MPTLQEIAQIAANRLTDSIRLNSNDCSLETLHQRRDRIAERFQLVYVPDRFRFFPIDETCTINQRIYLIDDVFTCERCGCYADNLRSVASYNYNGRQTEEGWCEDCHDSCSYFCEGCDQYFTEDSISSSEDACYCHRCEPEHREPPSYHSARRWTIADCSLPSYSIELEIEARERGELIAHLENRNFSRVSWERDGSLDCEKGLEILIQHRESLRSIANDTCAIVSSIKGKGFDVISSNSRVCGLHLNCNRDSRWNLHRIMRLLYIVRKLKHLFVKISNRESEHWASFNCDGLSLKYEAMGHGGKYRAIRIGNDRFEWRMFRGTLKEARIRLYCLTVESMESLAYSDVPAHHLKRIAEEKLRTLINQFNSNQI